jgi:hypothetical protein
MPWGSVCCTGFGLCDAKAGPEATCAERSPEIGHSSEQPLEHERMLPLGRRPARGYGWVLYLSGTLPLEPLTKITNGKPQAYKRVTREVF